MPTKYPAFIETPKYLTKEEVIDGILYGSITEIDLDDYTQDKNKHDITTLSAYRQDGSYNIYVSGRVDGVYKTQALEFMERDFEESSDIISEFLSTNNFLKLHHN